MYVSIRKVILEVLENVVDIGYFCIVYKGVGVG